MSIFGYLNSHDCRQSLWLGKPLHRDGRPLCSRIGGPDDPPHWRREQPNQVMWKFLADHAGHRIDVRIEYEMSDELNGSQEIDGDSDADIGIDMCLAGWPGLMAGGGERDA